VVVNAKGGEVVHKDRGRETKIRYEKRRASIKI
jgi:hypothetical protein